MDENEESSRLCRIILACRNSEQCFLGTLASISNFYKMKHLTLKEVKFVSLEIKLRLYYESLQICAYINYYIYCLPVRHSLPSKPKCARKDYQLIFIGVPTS